MVKIKKTVSIIFLLMGMLLLVVGCAEDEAPFQSVSPLKIVLQGPSGDVEFNAYVTFKWAASGGSGTFTGYSYTFGANAAVNTTGNGITFRNLSAGTYNFSVVVTDSKGATATSVTRSINVSTDGVDPIATITGGPAEGSKVATGGSVTFNWSAVDSSTFGAIDGYTYKLENTEDGSYLKQSTGTVQAVSATFDSLTTGAYTFSMGTVDNAGNIDVDSVKFEVMPAKILWIDDDYKGGLSEEFIEKMNDWGVALNGLAWQELDMNDTYAGRAATLDIMENLVNGAGSTIETIVWDENGSDDNSLLRYSTNDSTSIADQPWLRTFLNNGGNLVLIGSNMMGQMVVDGDLPPAAGDFEDVYMGIYPDSIGQDITTDTTFSSVYDSSKGGYVTIMSIAYDTSFVHAYDDNAVYAAYGGYTTLTGANGYTDISIDVAKDEGTHQSGIAWNLLRPEATPIMLDDAGVPVSYIYDPPTTAGKVVILGMNLWFSPTAEIISVIQKILVD